MLCLHVLDLKYLPLCVLSVQHAVTQKVNMFFKAVCRKHAAMVTNCDWDLNAVHKDLQSISVLHTSPFNLKIKEKDLHM